MLEILLCISDPIILKRTKEEIDKHIDQYHYRAKIVLTSSRSWEMIEYLNSNDGAYFIVIDFFFPNGERGADIAKDIREKHRDSYVVFFSDSYKNMQAAFEGLIRPCGFFKTPYETKEFLEVLSNSYTDYVQHVKQKEYYMVKMGNVHHRIDLNTVVYLEAADKRLYINTFNQRIAQIDTLESVEERLGEGKFMRCHKAFIVNADCITQYDFATMNLTLSNEAIVPFTRKYKAVVKAAMEQKTCHSSSKTCILSESIE